MSFKEKFLWSLSGIGYLLLSFLSTAWAYFFYLIIKDGDILCTEPNRAWLYIEFLLTIGVAVLGIFLFIRFIKNN